MTSTPGSRRWPPLDKCQGFNIRDCCASAIERMKMRWRVIAEIHLESQSRRSGKDFFRALAGRLDVKRVETDIQPPATRDGPRPQESPARKPWNSAMCQKLDVPQRTTDPLLHRLRLHIGGTACSRLLGKFPCVSRHYEPRPRQPDRTLPKPAANRSASSYWETRFTRHSSRDGGALPSPSPARSRGGA